MWMYPEVNHLPFWCQNKVNQTGFHLGTSRAGGEKSPTTSKCVSTACVSHAGKRISGGCATTRACSGSLPRRASNARKRQSPIDLFVGGEGLEGGEKAQWESLFEGPVESLSAAERKKWAAGLEGVACSSDAFFPFPDNVHRARKSGVKYLAAPSGSVMDEECVKAADEHGMAFVHTSLRLFHH